MPRFARVVVPGCRHHVTQRGNRRQAVFFEERDRAMYLRLLAEHTRRHSVAVSGYCLMDNHVHLLVEPATEDALAKALGRTHVDYARWFNVTRAVTGHLWQNRFYSTVVDWDHEWAALRYIELNPVRAGMTSDAAGWAWSSAAAHLSGVDRTEFLDLAGWSEIWDARSWEEALRDTVADALFAKRIREATRTGRPTGSPEFIAALEARLERMLRPAKRGPKPKERANAEQPSFGIS